MSFRTIIVGLGNDILADDAAGIHVARRLAPLLEGNPDVEVVEATVGGMRLIELLSGFDRAIVVDALLDTDSPVGTITKHRLTDFKPSSRLAAFHDIDIATAAKLAELSGFSFPADIEIIAIHVHDVFTISESISPEVEKAVDEVVGEMKERFGNGFSVR